MDRSRCFISCVGLFLLVIAIGTATAQGQVIYNNIPPTLAPSVPSYGAEAYSYIEYGDWLNFGPGSRKLASVRVIMVDWACQTGQWNLGNCVSAPGSTWTHPITLNIYSTAGVLLFSRTQTFTIPFRPSATPAQCGNATQWFNAATNTCQNGFLFPIDFNFSGTLPDLPNSAIMTVAYNTNTQGPNPLGATGPWDALNVSAAPFTPTIGSNNDPNGFYVRFRALGAGMNCGVVPINQLVLDTPCHATERPLFAVTAVDPAAFQVRYAANLTAGDSVINISNDGTNGASLNGPNFGTPQGNICVNVYAFSPDEQMIACCSCVVTPNGLVSLSVVNDIVSNTLTGVRPSSVALKLIVTSTGGALGAPTFTGTSCTNTAANVTTMPLAGGMKAWGTTLHADPTGVFATTETQFLPANLNAAELASLANRCTNIIGNGSTFGICRSCRLGGLGAARQ